MTPWCWSHWPLINRLLGGIVLTLLGITFLGMPVVVGRVIDMLQ